MSPRPREQAEEAINELRAALAQHGIILPAMSIDVAGVTAGYPLVQLGSAPADTVRRIAAVLVARPV